MSPSPLLALVKKDMLLEWRQKHALASVAVYAGATIFSVYLMMRQPERTVWAALFWIVQLFIAVTSVSKSFLQEPQARFRYYYTIVKPGPFLLAKMIYSVALMTLMCGISLLLFFVLLGNPLFQPGLFCAVALLGSCSLAVLFTFLSAIASRAGQNPALIAILGFPLATPILLMLAKLSQAALMPVFQEGWWSLAGILLGVDVLIVVLGWILFPFLWQE